MSRDKCIPSRLTDFRRQNPKRSGPAKHYQRTVNYRPRERHFWHKHQNKRSFSNSCPVKDASLELRDSDRSSSDSSRFSSPTISPLQEIQESPSATPSIESTFTFPSIYIGSVLGPFGIHMEGIKFESGAKVTVLLEPSENIETRSLLLEGTEEQVEEAAHMFRWYINENVPRDGDVTVLEMEIPAGLFPNALGRHGRTLRRITEVTGIRVSVLDPHEQKVRLVLAGDEINAQLARHLILIAIGSVSRTNPAPIEVDLPKLLEKIFMDEGLESDREQIEYSDHIGDYATVELIENEIKQKEA
ncbi:unnamed protein product [Caenorhabditis sp. 36 PRJEB53466]|nr:unnamed protein product [Caenorhabditis sp. 36 PRJEB53466]